MKYLLTYYEGNGTIECKLLNNRAEMESFPYFSSSISCTSIPLYKCYLCMFSNHLKIWCERIFKDTNFNSVAVNYTKNEYACEPSGDRYLRKVLKMCNVTTDDIIADIGCGNGSALKVISRFPFKYIHGYEKDPTNWENCRHNLLHLNPHFPHKHYPSSVYLMDALDIPDVMLSQYTYFYLFNPFNSVIMEQFLQKLDREKRYGQRIIYRNPICHPTLKAHGYKKEFSIKDFAGIEIAVYSRKEE